MSADRSAGQADHNQNNPKSSPSSGRLKTHMNTATESSQVKSSASSARPPHSSSIPDEITQVKRELLQAEVRHARARAAVSGAEADVKVLNARLKALTK
jgi:hypothetical protein